MCRSRRELSNAYFLAKFRFDTDENEPCTFGCAAPGAYSVSIQTHSAALKQVLARSQAAAAALAAEKAALAAEAAEAKLALEAGTLLLCALALGP